MLTNIIFYSSIALSLISLSVQNLNKRTVLSGLGDLDYSFLRAPTSPAGHGGNRNLCHCNGASPQDVLTVTYQGSESQNLVLCMCPNAVTGASHMIDTMGKVPAPIRRYNKAMISATAGTCGGAGSSGDVSFYCSSNMHVSVFIHESAHSMDRGKSASREWHDAVARDSCVPDAYANSNYADNFAQVVVLWVHLVGKGRDKDLGGSQFSYEFDQIVTCFEDLSNELLCEIFDYLAGYRLYEAFSNLNFRFEQLLHSSSVLLKTSFCIFNNDEIMNRFKQFMFANRHQIFSLQVTFILYDGYFFSSSFSFDSSFDRLESIVFKDIPPDALIPLLSNLSSLPHLFSLTIETSDIKEKINDIYRLIFVLPKLKYYRIFSSDSHHSITLPIAMNNQFSPIEYLVINHYCSLNELTCLLSYTPQLRHLTLHKTKSNNDSNITILPSIILDNLKSIYLDLYRTKYNELEIFMTTKIFSNLKSLCIFGSRDITFLYAYRWEQLILNYFPRLEKFYLIYNDYIDDEQNYPIYTERRNQFSSSFWIKRQWLFEVEVKNISIEYTIHPYSNRWYYETKDNIIDCSAFINLTFERISDSIFDEEGSKKIERILTITQIYYLEILEKELSIPVLIQVINLLPNITTLKIHSLSTDETTELTVKELRILCSMKRTSQITKVYLEEICDVHEELDFLFTLCPYMKYFKVGCTNITDVQWFLRTIFKEINRNNNHHLRLLCFHAPIADDRIVENMEEIIKYDKLLPHFTVKCILDSVYLQWK
ncbi:unnamed protein product [Rotaria sp. Silwood1]|nr:unnamed protein product [Rotaria sp. Silwood1]